jgi:c-di-GMP-binding flagellar brake protein YcgR
MTNNERRKHPRIDTDVTVEVYTSTLHLAEPEVAEICNVINLSETGMRFCAARRFDEKGLLRLTFLLPDSIIIIRTDARVVHIRKSGNNHFETGVQFAKINPAERKLIRHYVNKILQIGPPPGTV